MSARHYPQIPTLALAITFTLATLAAPLAAEAQLCLRLQRGPASEYGSLCRDDKGHGRGDHRRMALMSAALRATMRRSL
jgi:hypothetical protein